MQYISALMIVEMLCVNLYVSHICHERKASPKIVVPVMVAFTLLLLGFSALTIAALPGYGEGSFVILGFFYVIPLALLYRCGIKLTLSVMCLSWSYTMLLFLFSQYLGQVFPEPAQPPAMLIIQTAMYSLTLRPFLRLLHGKLLYVISHARPDRGNMLLRLSLSTCATAFCASWVLKSESLAAKLAEDLGVELDMQNISFNSVVPEVQAGNADMAIAGLTPNPERKQSVDMSEIYYGGGQCMLVREEDYDKYSTPESLVGETLATQKAALQETLLGEQFPDSEALLLPTFPQCIAELVAGNCAAVLIDDTSAEQYMKTTEGITIGAVPVETDPSINGNSVAVMKGNTDLLEWVNERIAEYQEQGLIQQWFDEAVALADTMGIE